MPLTKLDTKNGLSGINARKIVKDRFGFMWFATQEGLSRFDGRSYINLNSYNVDTKRKISGTDIFDIKTDVTGNFLWALSSYGGLNKIDLKTCNVVASYQINQSTKPGVTLWYKCLVEKGSNLIIGTNEGIISRFNTVSATTDLSLDLGKSFNCYGQLEDMMIDSNDRIWYFVSGTGILITDLTLTKKLTFISSSQLCEKPFYFTDYAVFGKTLFLTTTNGLRILDIKRLSPRKLTSFQRQLVGKFENQELHAISVSAERTVICGKNILSAVNIITEKIEPIKFAGNYDDKSWMTFTNAIYIDQQNIWIGSQYGVGWIRNDKSAFVSYFNSFTGSNIKINHAVTLCVASDSTILVCGDDGLYLLNHFTSEIKKFSIEDFYYSAFKGPFGYFIASGVSKGLQLLDAKLNPKELSSVFPDILPLKGDLIMCGENYRDSLIFMASQNKNGLYIWNVNEKRIDTINTRSGNISLLNDNINRLFIDSKKRLWIICENAISIYDFFQKKIKHLTINDPKLKVPVSINMDICELNNRYWLTSYGTGLVEIGEDFKLNRIYGVNSGFKSLGLYKVFGINDSLLIISSNNGLIALDFKNNRTKNYYVEDGLQSNSFEEASGDRRNDFIFFGGINGVSRIDLSKLNSLQSIPRVTFSTITLTSENKKIDTLNIGIQKINIPSEISQIIIHFSAINYFEPEKIKFAYRILGSNKDWNYTSENFVQSFRLVPGNYFMQVKAANEDGVWSQPIELELIFLPKWYQTWWFKALILLAVITIAYALYRLRIAQIKKEQIIRTKLASDLHDDLGSTLNSVKVYANLALMERGSEKYLHKVKESIQEAITGTRDIIWVLDDKKDMIQHLFARIDQFAQPLCEANGIQYSKHISEDAAHYKLSQEEKRNLYMILKEAINNSIKYAEAGNLELQVNLNRNKPSITIMDNGKGFDPENAGEGNGLKNMKRRSTQINYNLEISSEKEKGTTIYLRKN